jgi:hypothetical protein
MSWTIGRENFGVWSVFQTINSDRGFPEGSPASFVSVSVAFFEIKARGKFREIV